MAWLPYTGQGGLAGWGAPPQLHAGDVSGLAQAIYNRNRQQQQDVIGSVTDIIKQRERDKMANQLMQTFPQYGLEPSPFTGQGEEGLKSYGTLAQAIQERQ